MVIYSSPTDTTTTNPDALTPFEGAHAQPLKYSTGTAAFCLESIVHHNDLMEVREKTKAKRDQGKILKEELEEGKKVTAGQAFKGGTCRLG